MSSVNIAQNIKPSSNLTIFFNFSFNFQFSQGRSGTGKSEVGVIDASRSSRESIKFS